MLAVAGVYVRQAAGSSARARLAERTRLPSLWAYSSNRCNSLFQRSSKTAQSLRFARPTRRNSGMRIARSCRMSGSPCTAATGAATTIFTRENAATSPRKRAASAAKREVQIDMIANANPAYGRRQTCRPFNKQPFEVTTSNLSFNRDTGEASTPAPVEFKFATGHGSGVGVSYSTQDSIVRLEQSVQFELTPSDQTNGMPVSATGSSLRRSTS